MRCLSRFARKSRLSAGLSWSSSTSHAAVSRLPSVPMSYHSQHSDSRQALLFDADRDSRTDVSESSIDTIEMSGLEEIPVTPARRHSFGRTHYGSDSHDSDEDSDVEDSGDQALLGSHLRPRGRERIEEHPTDTFSQVKRIVLEVCS